MASFKQHISGGFITGVVSAGIALTAYGVSIYQAGITFIFAALGSVLPDIDCDTSTPLKFLFGYIGIILPVVTLHYLYADATMETTILFIVFGYIFIKDFISILFLKFTIHRGIIHSIPMAIIAAQLTFLLFFDSALKIRIVFSIACLFGFLTHLLMDEIWSIDLLGANIKKSFGSAFTLKGESILKTILAYTAIIGLGYIIYLQLSLGQLGQ